MVARQTYTRRRFLKVIAASSLAGLAAYKMGHFSTSKVKAVSDTRLLMGTIVNLTIATEDEHLAYTTINACFNKMSWLEAVMSRYQSMSQVSLLNKQGYLNDPSADLVAVLQESQAISRLSDGAFDVTIKPLSDLYLRLHQTENRLPTDDEIQATRQSVGYQNLVVTSDKVELIHPNMAIALDSIAKGYIIDQGCNILESFGFRNFLVEAGGDLTTRGINATSENWTVGIRNPRGEVLDIVDYLSIHNQAVATSGDYTQSYSADLSAHHIIDPRTGYSAPELASVTVCAETGLLADGLATALMVMNVDEGISLLDSVEDTDATFIGKSGWRFNSS